MGGLYSKTACQENSEEKTALSQNVKNGAEMRLYTNQELKKQKLLFYFLKKCYNN